ncbi:MAG: hypothetical protein HQ592_06895 [Planctomycetes bacterium]|nr:hypothetical protein [Planctomycetota bacterium]
MFEKLPRCEFCGRPFTPNHCNVSRQRYCTDPTCVLERKRKRQREWHAKQLVEDPEFREKWNTRCREANRLRRSTDRSGPDPPGLDHDPAVLSEVIIGLLSQITDSNDPVLLQASMREYAARGRRMALSAYSGKDPP